MVSRGRSGLRSAAQGSLSPGWPGWGLSRRGLARARSAGLSRQVGPRGGGAQQMWGLTPRGLASAEGTWAWFMAGTGWASRGPGPLLYGRSVPGGVVCKCEHTSKWESDRDNSYRPGGKFTRLENVYSPWLQRVCGAGETPLKCKAAPLPWRAGHGQPRPREWASKDTGTARGSAG